MDIPSVPNISLNPHINISWIYASMAVLTLYEYFLTLPDEYDIVWRPRKFTGATWLFLCNRYLMVFKAIVQSVAIARPEILCTNRLVLLIMTIFLGLIPALVAAVFTALRLYAVAKSKRLAGGFALALGIIPVVMTTLMFVFEELGLYQCSFSVSDITSTPVRFLSVDVVYDFQALSYVGPAVAILSDILVIIITWIMTFKPSREARKLGFRSMVVWILFRDGSIYFVALTIMNVSQIMEYQIWGFGTSAIFTYFYPVGGATGLLQQILISRFILNLRRCADDTSGMISTVEHDSTNLLGFSFHRSGNATTGLLGSMEGDLTHGFRGEEDDDESFDIRPID